MRRLLHTILQALIDAEAAEHIGADPHERTDARTTYRNGTRDKTVSTTSGDLTVKIVQDPHRVLLPVPADPPAAYRRGVVGGRAKLYRRLGGTLPTAFDNGLVRVRNAATHEGASLSGTEALVAEDIARGVVDLAVPLAGLC